MSAVCASTDIKYSNHPAVVWQLTLYSMHNVGRMHLQDNASAVLYKLLCEETAWQ